MSRRTFRQQKAEQGDLAGAEALLTTQPVAVYYRQSTTAQVGNISTTIQTLDMVDELERRGWQRDNIILIDDDEGVSGTKRIDEREGMSQLFELIADRKIGAVACQDEDRLFRDMTQIQVNIFIDACRKSNVKVITPYLTYDFAHPLYGEFHARQFRFKCDMAAEYLNSYVLGRLAPARRKLLLDGKWAGAHVPVGYMVDNRKQLPDGTDNPNWRKFVPFEPYAQIVREHFRIFVENGGAIRKAMRQIRDQRLSFPQCKPPDGFKVSYQHKNRGDGYYVNRGSFILMLTNPVYIGHWCYRGVVQRWNNHPPLIEIDTFMRAFNFLSHYTLTGEENPDFQPAYQYARPDLDAERTAERPLLAGLIFTEFNGRRYRTGTMYENRNSCYLYVQHRVEIDGTVVMWARRSQWIDDAVVRLFRQKLLETFRTDEWTQMIREDGQFAERERKIKRLTLASLTEEKQNIVASLGKLTDLQFIQDAEQRYKKVEKERERLTAELANLELKRERQITIEQAYRLFERAAADWDSLTQDEKRNTLALFVERIEATDYNRSGDMRLIVSWRDGKQDEIKLWHKPHGNLWSIETVERLLAMFDAGASQLEIAQVFPNLKWYQIFNEIKKHRGLIRFTPVYLGKQVTYADFIARGGGKGMASPSLWRPEEIEQLRGMVEGGATQIEIMQRFPYRRWIQLQYRIRVLFGTGTRVPYSGISQRLTYVEYARQTNGQDRSDNPQSAQDTLTTNSDRCSETLNGCF